MTMSSNKKLISDFLRIFFVDIIMLEFADK